jgi:lysophospholipase L1-like esterase
MMNGLLVCASLALCLGAVEAGARVYFHFFPRQPATRYAFRMKQPPPYRNAPYFSRAFVDESFQQPNGWHVPPGTRLVVPGDFHGAYINVVDGRRWTTDVPASPRRTVFVVGGSTIYGAEVPDFYTIPSYLQRLLNARQPGVWRVENCGSIGLTAQQEVELLRTEPLRERDWVILYDGANDVVQGVYNGDPRGWIVGENRKILRGAGPFKTMLTKLNLKYAASKAQRYSVFLSVVLGGMVNSANLVPKSHLLDARKTAALAQETATVFRQAIAEAARFAASRNCGFAHFLEPQVFAAGRRTPYEESLVRNYYISPNGLEAAFQAAWPLLQQTPSYDLSHILDQRAEGEEFYLDYCHVNHAANARIAAAMAEKIRWN